MGRILWLASYPKAGNTWVRTFMINLIANRPEPVPFADHGRFAAEEPHVRWYQGLIEGDVNRVSMRLVASMRGRAQARLAAAYPRNVLVKTHCANHKVHGYPQINKAVSSGAVYVLRNPLDLVISYADHMGLEIDEAIENIGSFHTLGTDRGENPRQVPELLSDWSSHVRSWTARPNERLHVVRYEDLIDRPHQSFAGIARFLGIDPDGDRGRLERAIAFSSFETLKAAEASGEFTETSPHAERFFREGRKDQWREVLSEAQITRITDRHREQMRRFGYA